MSQVGRISGPLLKANLERKGVDLAFETDLLYLDVQGRYIGVRKNNPSHELEITNSGLRTTDIELDFPTTVNGIEIDPTTGSITSSNSGEFIIEADNINVPKLATDDLTFLNNTIATTLSNSSIDITPTGRVNFGATTNVAGNVFINGNALYFSYTITDPLTASQVSSIGNDLRPAINNTGSVGNQDYNWDETYFKDLVSNSLILPSLPPGFSVPLVHPGNILYVSTQGFDTNFGTIQTSPFRTLEKALSVATAGMTILITSGTYTEVFPLTVPAGVAVIGQSIRSVTIQPTAGTIDKDAFLLNGETTIEDLTVSGFRYNGANNTGHAFRLADNFTITTKSPYIRNVSVITKGSNITLSDPLSYGTHDAGRGAYIDGRVANPSSNQAGMLFYGVTFITPGVDAITMTNGVRVESIDTFTYYANRGYYATQGLEGFANNATVFGAELRCISSANVYGKYGIVGNGADVLAYLIGHNFSYIGSEKDSSNDTTLVSQANEIVEFNGAKIHYQSTDQRGNFRVGDYFLVNFKDGTTSFSGDSFDLSGLSIITINDGVHNTILAPYEVESNNFRFSGSTIETITGPVNFNTATGLFLLDNNVTVGKNLAVTGNVDFKGTITVGNQSSDTVTIAMDLNQDIVPDVDDTYNLGSSSKRWINTWVGRVDLPNLIVDNNTITALNSNLNLIGNGTGGVVVDGLTFTDNKLSASTGVNIRLKPISSSYVVYVDSTGSLRLPSGTTVDMPVMNTGEIRYSTSANLFIGQRTFRSALGGVFSSDRNTKIVAHPTNNTIPFVVNNNNIASITPTAVTAIGINVDKISASGTTISTSNSDNLVFGNTGASSVYFNNIKFEGDNIINETNDPIIMPGSMTSYVKFSGTTAILGPAHSLSAPDSMEIGTIRFNPDTQCMEVWDGDSFDNFGGVGGNATEDDVEQLTNLWTLILG